MAILNIKAIDQAKQKITTRRAAGDAAEQQALDFLLAQGLTLIARNVQCKVGELDIIMQDGQSLVFVEVKLRSSSHFGGALSSVTFAKTTRLKRAAQWYLMSQFGQRSWPPCRFDVVAWDGTSDGKSDGPSVTWIKNALDG